MKKLLFAATVLFISFAATAQKSDDKVKMNTELHDFGKVAQGKPVTFEFELTNISEEPIAIENASASCGCTVPSYEKAPILPGKSTKITVQYSAAAVGPFNKDVYIKLAGVEEMKTVHIKGEVLAPGK